MMIAQTGISLRDLYRAYVAGKKGKLVLNVFLIILFLAVPPVIETIYIMNYRLYITLLVTAVYLILPAVMFYFAKKSK